MTTRQQIKVMEAFTRGEEIEYICKYGIKIWTVTNTPLWDWDDYIYRIKEKPKYMNVNALTWWRKWKLILKAIIED